LDRFGAKAVFDSLEDLENRKKSRNFSTEKNPSAGVEWLCGEHL